MFTGRRRANVVPVPKKEDGEVALSQKIVPLTGVGYRLLENTIEQKKLFG